MKVVTIVGARPQFIKASAVSKAFRNNCAGKTEEVLVHTGQHHDANMSDIFFEELAIPKPDYNLEIRGGSLHGAVTGRMMESIEQVLIDEKPEWVLVYGDTNSTLAGALAAVKLHIPVAHVEAGLRSFNFEMPEEVNRIVADRVSTLLFCPTETAVSNLAAEGMEKGVRQVGDVMFDVALHYGNYAEAHSTILKDLGVESGEFALATCHRAENTDDSGRLHNILLGLARVAEKMPVILPMHPRTQDRINTFGLGSLLKTLHVIKPLPFLDMLILEKSARVILTDSGGVQKEAFFYRVPCVTMRDETEWVETVHAGWNQIVGADSDRIYEASQLPPPEIQSERPYGNGDAAGEIVKEIMGFDRSNLPNISAKRSV